LVDPQFCGSPRILSAGTLKTDAGYQGLDVIVRLCKAEQSTTSCRQKTSKSALDDLSRAQYNAPMPQAIIICYGFAVHGTDDRYRASAVRHRMAG